MEDTVATGTVKTVSDNAMCVVELESGETIDCRQPMLEELGINEGAKVTLEVVQMLNGEAEVTIGLSVRPADAASAEGEVQSMDDSGLGHLLSADGQELTLLQPDAAFVNVGPGAIVSYVAVSSGPIGAAAARFVKMNVPEGAPQTMNDQEQEEARLAAEAASSDAEDEAAPHGEDVEQMDALAQRDADGERATEEAPNPPSDLTGVLSDGGITLSWSDNSDNEEYFVIERTTSDGAWGEVMRSEANETEWTDTEVEDDTLYCYRVASYGHGLTSAFSNEARIKTGDTDPAASAEAAAQAQQETVAE